VVVARAPKPRGAHAASSGKEIGQRGALGGAAEKIGTTRQRIGFGPLARLIGQIQRGGKPDQSRTMLAPAFGAAAFARWSSGQVRQQRRYHPRTWAVPIEDRSAYEDLAPDSDQVPDARIWDLSRRLKERRASGLGAEPEGLGAGRASRPLYLLAVIP